MTIGRQASTNGPSHLGRCAKQTTYTLCLYTVVKLHTPFVHMLHCVHIHTTVLAALI